MTPTAITMIARQILLLSHWKTRPVCAIGGNVSETINAITTEIQRLVSEELGLVPVPTDEDYLEAAYAIHGGDPRELVKALVETEQVMLTLAAENERIRAELKRYDPH